MMFTSKYRPKTLEQICGQPLVVEAMKAVIKNPEQAPRVYIFHGEFGTGKTSMARLLAQLLNKVEGSLDFVGSGFREYDSSIAGSKEEILDLREDLFSTAIGTMYRVVVLDEFHLASRQGQSTLLKTLEDLPANIFIIFCTTRVDKILPTIRSRAVELAFQAVGDEALKLHLVKVVNSEGIEVEDGVLDYIIRRSHGHVRDAVMMLDAYQSLGSTASFLTVYRDAKEDVLEYLEAVRGGDGTGLEAVIGRLAGYPVETVRADIFIVVRELLRRYTLRAPDGVSPCAGTPVRALQETSGKDPLDPGDPAQALYRESPSCRDKLQQSQLPPLSLQLLPLGTHPKETCNPSLPLEGDVTCTSPETYGTLVSQYGRSLLDLLAFLSTDWAVNCLADMARCEGLLWSLAARFRGRVQGSSTSTYRKI